MESDDERTARIGQEYLSQVWDLLGIGVSETIASYLRSKGLMTLALGVEGWTGASLQVIQEWDNNLRPKAISLLKGSRSPSEWEENCKEWFFEVVPLLSTDCLALYFLKHPQYYGQVSELHEAIKLRRSAECYRNN